MDGSVVGRGCVALMLHVVYKGRALPLVWQVRQGTKGHFPEALHIALIEQVQKWIPVGALVVLLGDGEFDGFRLQQTLAEANWCYVCRTGCHMTASWQGEPFRLDTLGTCIKPGTLVAFSEVRFTEAAYGPIMLIWPVKDCGHDEYIDDISHPRHPQAKIEDSPNYTRLLG